MGDPETLLFVDDQQAQVLELHIRREQAVRADDDIDLPLCQPGDDLFLLLGCAEAGEHLDRHREGCQALA